MPPDADDRLARFARALREESAKGPGRGLRRFARLLRGGAGLATRDKLALAKLRLPGRLMFLLRIRFGLYAVLSRLGAVCDWSALERRLAAESGFASRP